MVGKSNKKNRNGYWNVGLCSCTLSALLTEVALKTVVPLFWGAIINDGHAFDPKAGAIISDGRVLPMTL